MIKNQATEYSPGQQETSTKEIMIPMSETVMDKCTGTMEATIKDNGKMGSNMVKVRFMYLAKDLKKAYLKIMCL